MRKTHYTQNTSDYRTVSKKIRCAQKARKLQIRARLTERFTLSIGLKIYRWTMSIFNDVFSFLLKVREAYKTYMKKIAKYLGGGPDSDEQMMKVYEFETKLAMVCQQRRFESETKECSPEILLYFL